MTAVQKHRDLVRNPEAPECLTLIVTHDACTRVTIRTRYHRTDDPCTDLFRPFRAGPEAPDWTWLASSVPAQHGPRG